MNYLTFDEVVGFHDILIEKFGGSYGIRDIKLLESAIMRPQIGYYHSINEEAGAIMESFAINHPFIDGNKRVSFFMMDTFLRMNGYYIECDNEKSYQYFMKLFESNEFSYEKLFLWINSNIKPI